MRAIGSVLIIILLFSFLPLTSFIRPAKCDNELPALWNLDEGSGTVAHDSSGNGNDGILCNGPTWVNGKSGKSLNFNGVDQYVEVAGNTDLNPHRSDWTVSAWVNIASLSAGPFSCGVYGFVIAGKRQDPFQEGLTLLAHWGSSATSQARFGFIFDQPHAMSGAVTPLMNVFGWHYVVGVRNGANLTVYVDGVAYGPNNYAEGDPSPIDSDISSDTPLQFAHHGAWGEYDDGTIDEVRIYNRALTRQEILADMYQGGPSYPNILVVQNNETRFWFMDYALNQLAIPHTNIRVCDLATVNLSEYQIISIGSSIGYIGDVKQYLDARASDISAWVADGGSLFVEGQCTGYVTIDLYGNLVQDPASGYCGWVPGNPNLRSDQYGNAVHIVCPTHPLVENLTDSSLSGWNTAPNGYFDSYLGQEIAVQSGYPDRTALFVYGLGKGIIICSCLNADCHCNYNGKGSAGKNDAEAFIENVVDYCSHVLGPRFNISIDPSKTTTSIGGTANFDLAINNFGDASDMLTLKVQGVDPSWYSLSKNNFTMIPGGTEHVELDMTVPEDTSNVGAYFFNVSISGILTQESVSASLIVIQNPLMYSLEPDTNTILGTTNLLIFWMTSSNASSEIYIKRVGDLIFDHFFGDAGKSHYVYANNLSRNTDYLWYAYSETAYGNVSSDTRTLHISNGISFTQRSYTFNVQRDYSQHASVSVTNNDTQSHDLLLEALNPYQDLIVGFIGPGSVDENLTVASGETTSVAFNMFAQDAMQQNYTFTIKLTNLGPEQITDYALVNVNVRQPNINLTLTEESADPVTLSKTITATNYGDPITDLSIGTSDNLISEVSFEPTVSHAYLPTGGSLKFQVVPVLTTDFTDIEGLITATGAGQLIATLQVNFTLPPGKSVYSVTIPQVSIEFSNYYDTDDSPNTNPLPDQPVESYLADGTIIFASQIIVDVYQNGTPASGANVSLTVWDSMDAVASLDYTMTDLTGKALFTVVGPVGNYSYQAELADYDIETEKRSFTVSTSYLYEIHPNDITWLDVSDGRSTYNLTESMSTVTLTQAPFTFKAKTTAAGENATFGLVLRWDLDVFKRVYIPGSIQNDTLTFQTSGIPAGNFTAIIYYYSPGTEVSLSPVLNVTNTDSTGMYIQGNYTYYLPFPFNSTYFIRLVTGRSVSTRDPVVAFDLVNIEPADTQNSIYQLDYVIVSNETIQKDFQFYVNTTEGELYNTTFHLDLEPLSPVEVNFTIPVKFPNGTLRGEFDSTLSTDSASVTTKTTPQLSYIYDARIWVGSSRGILDPILWSISPPSGACVTVYQNAGSAQKEVIETVPQPYPGGRPQMTLITCGALAAIPGGVGYAIGWMKDSYDFATGADDIGDEVIVTLEYGAAGIVLLSSGTLETAGAVLLIGGLVQCAYDTVRVAGEEAEGSTGACVCVESKAGVWYCPNCPVMSAQVTIDPPSADVVQTAAAVKFSLPWPRNTYRPHNAHLFINGIEIGNLTNTIPNGYYIFPFNSSILNYVPGGLSANTITMKMDNLNGGHYVVTSDWEIILELKQLTLSVVASNQTEAESLVTQLSGTVASLPDFSMSPDLSFSAPQPKEGQSITITANVLNLGAAGMSYVPVDLYVDSLKVESAIIGFLPAFANQAADFVWTTTRGTHNITIAVNGGQLMAESDHTNNQVQTDMIVVAYDVAIAKATYAKNVVGQGFSFNVSVTAANNGDFAETFNVTVYANTTIMASQNVTLSTGDSITVTFTCNTAGFAYGNYTFSATAGPVLGETNTTDNTLTRGKILITIPGDINGDFYVDLGDLVLLSNAYGTSPSQPIKGSCVWNPNADIDGSGKVDLGDLVLLSNNYRQHYP